MGNELAKHPGGLALPPSGNPVPQGTRNRPERSDSSPRTPDPRTGTSAGTGTSTGTGTAGPGPRKAEEGKKLPELAPVKETVPAPAEPAKKQRRKPKKMKEEPQSFNAEQISTLIQTATSIVGSRPGMEIWTLRKEECDQLATPIANMVQKSEKLQNMGEYADAISLVTSALIIFAPRAVVFTQQQKQKKIQNAGGVKLVDGTKHKPEKGKGNGSNGGVHAGNAPNAEIHAPSIYESIPEPLF